MNRWTQTLSACLVAALAACGDDDAGTQDTTQAPDGTTPTDTTGAETDAATATETRDDDTSAAETRDDTSAAETHDDTSAAETTTSAETTDDTTSAETTGDTTPDDGDTSAPADPMYTVQILAPVDGKVFSAPLGIDPDGHIAGYIAVEAWGPDARAVRVTPAGEVTVLPVENVQSGFAYGLAGAGLVVGTNSFRPTAWVAGVEETMKVPDGWFSGSAQAVGAGGFIVGSYADSDDALPPNPVGPRPCTWATYDATPAPLATVAGADPLGIALDVNAAGVIAGTVATPNGFAAVRWASATADPVVVTLTGTTLSEAHAINAAGDVAGRATLADNTSRAFIGRVGEDGALLPPLVASEPYAESFDLDDAGRVVGTSRYAAGLLHATLWRADGEAVDLHDRLVDGLPEGAVYLSSAVAVTPDGTTIACEVVMDEGFGDSVRRIAILRAAAP